MRDAALAARGGVAAREAEAQLLLLLSLAHGVPLPRWLPPHGVRTLPYGRMPLVYSHNKTGQHPNKKITHIVYLSKKWRHAGSIERSYSTNLPSHCPTPCLGSLGLTTRPQSVTVTPL